MDVRIIVVMGVCGCGKTTLGAALAEQLRLPFLEGDDYHPQANIDKMSAGTPLTDDDRWPWLDALGTALAERARAQDGAVGACSALRAAYRQRLQRAAGTALGFVCLTAEREQLAARMDARADHFMPAALIDSQLSILELPGRDEDAILLSGSAPLADNLASATEFFRRPRT